MSIRTRPTAALLLAGLLLAACGGTPSSAVAERGSGEALHVQTAAVYCYSICGDRVCDIDTETYSCPADCGVNVCGDGMCCTENPSVCPQDCPYASDTCYDTPPFLTGRPPAPGTGARDEPPRNTSQLICVPQCGDNLCDINTEAYSCPADCGVNVCGDGMCCTENPSICPQDCPYASDNCYDTPPW